MDTAHEQAGFVRGWRVRFALLAAILIAIGVAGIGQTLQSLERMEMRQDSARVGQLWPRQRRVLWTINPDGEFERCAGEFRGCTRVYLVSTEHAKAVHLKFQAQFALAPAAIEAKKFPLDEGVLEGLESGAGVILHGARRGKMKKTLEVLRAYAEERGFQLSVARRAGMILAKRAGA